MIKRHIFKLCLLFSLICHLALIRAIPLKLSVSKPLKPVSLYLAPPISNHPSLTQAPSSKKEISSKKKRPVKLRSRLKRPKFSAKPHHFSAKPRPKLKRPKIKLKKIKKIVVKQERRLQKKVKLKKIAAKKPPKLQRQAIKKKPEPSNPKPAFQSLRPKIKKLDANAIKTSNLPKVKNENLPQSTNSNKSSNVSQATLSHVSKTNPANNGLLRLYCNQIRQQIENHKHYPFLARRMALEGKVIVAFTVGRDGQLLGIEIKRPCDYAVLNKAAIKAIKEAAPFPRFPKAIKQNSLKITLPIVFRLSE